MLFAVGNFSGVISNITAYILIYEAFVKFQKHILMNHQQHEEDRERNLQLAHVTVSGRHGFLNLERHANMRRRGSTIAHQVSLEDQSSDDES